MRALSPHVGAQVLLEDGTPLGVTRARVLDAGPGPAAAPAPGILSRDGPRPVLGCADGALELLAVKPPGRREMSGEDWLRGLRR